MALGNRVSVYHLGYYIGTAALKIPPDAEAGAVLSIEPTGVSLMGRGATGAPVRLPPNLTKIVATVKVFNIVVDPPEVTRALEVRSVSDAMRLPGWKGRRQ